MRTYKPTTPRLLGVCDQCRYSFLKEELQYNTSDELLCQECWDDNIDEPREE